MSIWWVVPQPCCKYDESHAQAREAAVYMTGAVEISDHSYLSLRSKQTVLQRVEISDTLT